MQFAEAFSFMEVEVCERICLGRAVRPMNIDTLSACNLNSVVIVEEWIDFTEAVMTFHFTPLLS